MRVMDSPSIAGTRAGRVRSLRGYAKKSDPSWEVTKLPCPPSISSAEKASFHGGPAAGSGFNPLAGGAYARRVTRRLRLPPGRLAPFLHHTAIHPFDPATFLKIDPGRRASGNTCFNILRLRLEDEEQQIMLKKADSP